MDERAAAVESFFKVVVALAFSTALYSGQILHVEDKSVNLVS